MKDLIIVTDKKNERYANYLRGLVSRNDDHDDMIVGTKDGEVRVSVYTEKEYEDNKAKISSTNRVIFIGNGKIAKNERLHLDIKFNKYGMVFGTLGTHACLYVDKIVPMKEYEDFYNYAKKIQDNAKKVTVKAGDVAQVAAGAAVGAGIEIGTAILGAATIIATGALLPVVAIGGAAVVAGGGVGTLKYNSKRKEIEEQQYDCLILKCYLENLNSFME